MGFNIKEYFHPRLLFVRFNRLYTMKGSDIIDKNTNEDGV